MSAFIVDKLVIDAIVKAGLELTDYPSRGLRWYVLDQQGGEVTRGHLEHLNADEVGQMLWDENHRSVDYRYTETNERPVYTYGRMLGMADTQHIPKVFGLLGLYEYQTCESPDWRYTEAHAFIDALRIALIHKLPGYDWPHGEKLPTLYGDRPIMSIFDLTTRRK